MSSSSSPYVPAAQAQAYCASFDLTKSISPELIQSSESKIHTFDAPECGNGGYFAVLDQIQSLIDEHGLRYELFHFLFTFLIKKSD